MPDIMPYLPVLYEAKSSTFKGTHYHANYVSPKWAKKLTLIAEVGKHKFYEQKL